ncbi:MAG: ABC transporter substrate-binding protein [Clostridium sp.]|uniref:ABC transporter substrate-binding protein n=1 Tax=Clostridium sp. DSM 8431 TaxID=1761781 RepID=UPI0008E8DB78|nr:ABC transporter substrate-binding protein [Clostridium sp. DSM 8431]MCR4944745.1 ABC transporter substrate-binding protein [Clostridium sp.]SFU80847.1 putative ABC transport system substrate-binding protein [Clostridium sp. DSM 8431]
MVGKKKIGVLLAGLMSAALFVSCGSSETSGSLKKVGVIQYIQHPALDSSNEGFIDGLKEKGYEEGKNIEVEQQNAQGKIDISQQLAGQFVSAKKDLIFAIATPTAQAVSNATKDIPIVFTSVTDPVDAGLADSLKSSGKNITGTTDKVNIDEQLELFKKMMPNAKKMGVIYTTSEANSTNQVKELKEVAPKYGLEIKEIGIANINEINQNLNNAISSIDSLYVPTDNNVAASYSLVGDICVKNKIPAVCAEPALVQVGGLVSKGIDYYELGKMAGIKAAEILDGKNPSDIAIEPMKELKITINTDVQEKLGIELPDDILDEAEKVTGGVN